MSSHVSVIINSMNKVLDFNPKYKANENINKWCESELLNKNSWSDYRATLNLHKCGDKKINGCGIPKTECWKPNTGWGKTNSLKMNSVNKKPPLNIRENINLW